MRGLGHDELVRRPTWRAFAFTRPFAAVRSFASIVIMIAALLGTAVLTTAPTAHSEIGRPAHGDPDTKSMHLPPNGGRQTDDDSNGASDSLDEERPTPTSTPQETPAAVPEETPSPTPRETPLPTLTETPATAAIAPPAPAPTPSPTPGAALSLAPPPCPDDFVIDFAGLPPGTVLGEQYSARGVHISGLANGAGFPDAILVFDSNGSGSQDPDLEVDVGNIAILAKNLNDAEADGLVDHPDENDLGGEQVYRFDQPVHIGSFLFIDKDHGTPDEAIAYDSGGNEILTVPIPLAGDGSVQRIDMEAGDVSRLVIAYRDSAALTGIEVCPPVAAPTPDPTPTPTGIATATPAPSPTPTALLILLPPTGGGLGPVDGLPGVVLVTGSALLVLAAGFLALRVIRWRPGLRH